MSYSHLCSMLTLYKSVLFLFNLFWRLAFSQLMWNLTNSLYASSQLYIDRNVHFKSISYIFLNSVCIFSILIFSISLRYPGSSSTTVCTWPHHFSLVDFGRISGRNVYCILMEVLNDQLMPFMSLLIKKVILIMWTN